MSSKLQNWLNIWLLGAIGLCFIYGYTLYLARNPNVSEVYRSYYIERSSDTPVWLAEGNAARMPTLELGVSYDHNAPEIVLVGWSNPEADHVWTLDFQALIFISLPKNLRSDRQYELVLRGNYLGGRQFIISSLAEDRIRKFYETGEDIVIPLPSSSLDQELLSVRLDLPQAKSPGPQDTRLLSFALQSMQLREGSP